MAAATLDDPPVLPRTRRAFYMLLAVVVTLELLAIVTASRDRNQWQERLWPFTAAQMFSQDSHADPGTSRRFSVYLVDGDREVPVRYGEAVHPFPVIGTISFQTRLRDDFWDERNDLGLAKALQRWRCQRGVHGTQAVIYASYWRHEDLLRGELKPNRREVARRITLPSTCGADL